MPALPSVPKVIRVDAFQTVGANAAVRNRFFLQYSGSLSNADLTTVLNTISTAWLNNLDANMYGSINTLTQLQGTDLSTSASPQVVVAASRVGVGNAPFLPNGAAVVLKFKTARRYRGGHPRFYACGIGSVSVTNGDQIVASSVTQFANAMSAFIAACVLAPPAAVGTLIHVNVSFFAGFTNRTFASGRIHPIATPRVTPLVDAVIGYSCNPRVASQRRRNQQSP